MAKYLVTFIVHGPYYDGDVKGTEVFGEICVNCHRDDAVVLMNILSNIESCQNTMKQRSKK